MVKSISVIVNSVHDTNKFPFGNSTTNSNSNDFFYTIIYTDVSKEGKDTCALVLYDDMKRLREKSFEIQLNINKVMS